MATHRLNVAEHRILLAIRHGQNYGLQIRESIQKQTGAAKLPSLGGIYTTLHRMERKGLIKGKWELDNAPRSGPPRRYYELTKTGSRVFEASRKAVRQLHEADPDQSDKDGRQVAAV